MRLCDEQVKHLQFILQKKQDSSLYQAIIRGDNCIYTYCMPWLLIFLPMLFVTKVPQGNGLKRHYTVVRKLANSCRSVWWNSRIYEHSLGQCVNTFQYCKHILKELDIKNLLTHSMEDSPSWEANWVSTSQEVTFYGTRRLITAFTSARHLSMFWAK